MGGLLRDGVGVWLGDAGVAGRHRDAGWRAGSAVGAQECRQAVTLRRENGAWGPRSFGWLALHRVLRLPSRETSIFLSPMCPVKRLKAAGKGGSWGGVWGRGGASRTELWDARKFSNGHHADGERPCNFISRTRRDKNLTLACQSHACDTGLTLCLEVCVLGRAAHHGDAGELATGRVGASVRQPPCAQPDMPSPFF